MTSIESTKLNTPTSSLSLTTLDYGSTIHSLIITSLKRDLLIGYKDPQDYHHQTGAGRGFRNQVVGRYANRVPSGEWETKEGIKLDLAGEDGVCLHGGPRGFDTHLWKTVPRSSSQLFPSSDPHFPSDSSSESEIIYSRLSPAGDQGFPLSLLVESLISISPPSSPSEGGPYESVGKVRIVLRAKIVDDGKCTKEELEGGTPVNLTLHWGFNLRDFRSGVGEDVKGHKLWIDASRTTELTPPKLATGSLLPLPLSSPLNFQHGQAQSPSSHRTIGSDFPESGLDNNIIFNSPINTLQPRLILTSPDEKVSLKFRTNQSSVQVYTAGHFDGSFSRKIEHEANGTKEGYDQFGAIFLEFQHPLSTFLHEELKEVAEGSTILKMGEIYENWVEVDVLVRS